MTRWPSPACCQAAPSLASSVPLGTIQQCDHGVWMPLRTTTSWMGCAASSATVAHPKRALAASPRAHHPWTQNRSVDSELPESVHCTFVTTATETLRRVDDGTSHALHWVPHPREHNINTAVACSKLATNEQSVHPFKPLSYFEQTHHARSSTRVLNVTTESSTTTTERESCTHKLVHQEALRTCVPRNPSLSSRVPVTLFHQSANDLDGLLVAVPESQLK